MALAIGNMFNTLNGGLLNNAFQGGYGSALTTAASTNYVSTYYIDLQQQLAAQALGPVQQTATPRPPTIEDEIGWLRRRVSEVCWQ